MQLVQPDLSHVPGVYLFKHAVVVVVVVVAIIVIVVTGVVMVVVVVRLGFTLW